MKFNLEIASRNCDREEDSFWGNREFINGWMKHETIEIYTLEELVAFGKKCECEIEINAKDMTLNIADYYDD